ncbi:response regulator receiver domain protein [Synechococcus sp. PCC 7335]|nr:response regulator receiver domain protein [Synechococcus sp. PCC 7335]
MVLASGMPINMTPIEDIQEKAVARKLTEKIRDCYDQKFTGLLKISGHKTNLWYVYLMLGRIVWAQSSQHPLRSWKRHLTVHSPTFCEQTGELAPYESWNYLALSRLVRLKQFPRDQFSKIVEDYVAEALFDILQSSMLPYEEAGEISIDVQSKEAADMPFLMLQKLQSWEKAQQDWQEWQQAGLAKLSPNWAPTIKLHRELKDQTSPQTFQTLNSFANGENTLRDLSIKLKQPIISIARSIFPYVSRQLLAFTEVSDIADEAHHGFHPETMKELAPATPPQGSPRAALSTQGPVAEKQTDGKLSSEASTSKRSRSASRDKAPTVVYIDDSPADSRAMCSIVEKLGYKYVNIQDPLQALPMLIELKPRLIFLDLVMPVANGYEVCSQIRRITAFKDIPVIIVTSNDGIADRVRAKLVGASGFMGKPIEERRILKVLNKYIPKEARRLDTA